MNDPDPVQAPALHEQATALRRVAEELDAAVAGTSALAGELAASWSDLVGLGWADRLDLVGRELARQADAAAGLARAVTGLAEGVIGTGPGSVPDAGDAVSSLPPLGSLSGPRLGGTEGLRAGERRGVVVPALSDEPG